MSITQHQSTMLLGTGVARHCSNMQLKHRSYHRKNLLHRTPVSRVAGHKSPTHGLQLSSSADSVADDLDISGLQGVTHVDDLSQHGRRPVQTPKSEDPEQLPAHRRVRHLEPPALAQQKLHRTATRHDPAGPTQEVRKGASGSHEMREPSHSRSAAPTSRQITGRAVPSDGIIVQSPPGHPQLQPYWSALDATMGSGE